MVWYIYPFGFNNIHFFYKRFYEISKGTGYEINSENFVRQFMLFAANMIGVVSGVKVLSIFFKIYSALLMLVLSIKNYYRRRERNSFFILTLTGIPLLLFFMQSFVVGNFFNFIPHYTVFFIPFWGILLFLEMDKLLADRKSVLHISD